MTAKTATVYAEFHAGKADRRVTYAVLAIFYAALTGCATTERLVEVKVPVPVECRETEPARPAMDTETLDPASTIDVQSRAMRAEIEIREGYEDRLRTALRNCIAPVQN